MSRERSLGSQHLVSSAHLSALERAAEKQLDASPQLNSLWEAYVKDIPLTGDHDWAVAFFAWRWSL